MISQAIRDQGQTLINRYLVKPVLENHNSEVETKTLNDLKTKFIVYTRTTLDLRNICKHV